ncbi:MAG TPA: hypothetical protein PK014_12815 [Thermoanaerobaculia bacterium]|nr:hypothetical protein [Thermoanaerobaculia bacterium]HUM30987.1 hypothetical protein [Thermoanaerobaculia bacterium]HXK69280.1 hypothetical protein [Thermoanaerobaculia bacterium]
MDFSTAARLGSLISKDYAEAFFQLLVNYRTISASEAASRLGLHIQTAQDFLENLSGLGVLSKEEVHEGKRPYFRYTLTVDRITIEVDFKDFIPEPIRDPETSQRIREKTDSGARFSTARNGNALSSVSVWTGKGRELKERRINLTRAQGRFLFHLPFPNAAPLTVQDIMAKAGVSEDHLPEVMDIISVLTEAMVIETV